MLIMFCVVLCMFRIPGVLFACTLYVVFFACGVIWTGNCNVVEPLIAMSADVSELDCEHQHSSQSLVQGVSAL